MTTLSTQHALFIGNSYTFGACLAEGGIPWLVTQIAASKCQSLDTEMLAVGGKEWAFHLERSITHKTLRAKPWNWVVLQDHSRRATRVGNPEAFMREGEEFFRVIREAAPQAKIVLYATWANQKDQEVYANGEFANPAEMLGDILANYRALEYRLRSLGADVSLSPVGTAFDLCVQRYPGINLFTDDLRHPSMHGSYLSALVHYCTLFQADPLGATHDVPGGISPEEAKWLQEIAWEVHSNAQPLKGST